MKAEKQRSDNFHSIVCFWNALGLFQPKNAEK